MRVLLAVLFLAVAAQATSWSNLRPMNRVMPTLRAPPRYSGRIIGGSLATTGQFKYQVAVLIDGGGFCGGSLIADNVVLTAGHCVDGARTWDITAGALKYSNTNEAGRVTVRSTDAVLHENYNSFTINNDIAIVRLTSAVSGPNIASVRVPSRSQASDQFVGTVARVSGWGKPSDASSAISDDLKFVDLTVITNTLCADYYGIIINANKICVDTNGGSVSTCNGDSGGPLVITESDGLPTEVGIVSFGSSAGCESGAPAAFARVTEYLDWLETNAGITIRP
ncbi:brachyurin-like [Neocloeon triangulifer]|uniref:brachyurin-like n=1 Tax=Neocloeon triangulifer TaxID=2078957 RepID=UPI00286F9F9C|nr:brachyurin-like [Neocloeon triangulifer]